MIYLGSLRESDWLEELIAHRCLRFSFCRSVRRFKDDRNFLSGAGFDPGPEPEPAPLGYEHRSLPVTLIRTALASLVVLGCDDYPREVGYKVYSIVYY